MPAMSENQPPTAPDGPRQGGGAGAFCPSCGTPLAPEARFCTKCGAARGDVAPTPPSPPVVAVPAPLPGPDATRVMPAARVVEREERFVDDEPVRRPAYAPVGPPPFNWALAALIGLGLVILVLGAVLFAQAQDDTGEAPSTTTLPTTTSSSSSTSSSTSTSTTAASTTTTTTASTTTTAATTTTTAPTTTTSSLPITTTT